MSLKLHARKILPIWGYNILLRVVRKARRVSAFLRLCADSLIDARRFFRWSHTGTDDRTSLQRDFALLKAYHGIEKGLSLEQPRPGFGLGKVQDIARKIDVIRVNDPASGVPDAATASLSAYRIFNQGHDIDLPWLESWFATAPQGDSAIGGTMKISRDDIRAAVEGVQPDFFLMRHSIRNFAPGDVPVEDIEAAARLAQKTPSVCNRQGTKVYCFRNATDALRHQRGNAGFGHLASRALVVTADLQAYSSVGERHQAYIDGGLFAMSLVYALHSMGYGCCMLAWNSRASEEASTRRELRIPESEAIIMMIAVGFLPETLQVARAWRRPLSDVLTVR